MKKSIIAALIVLFISAFCFAIPMTSYVHYGFSVKCARCVELHQKDSGLAIQIAWRTSNYKSENGKTYAEYRCAGGHKYWAEIR